MYQVFLRTSTDCFSSNFNHGAPMSWDSERNFTGYLRLMGCPLDQILSFNKTGQANFIVWTAHYVGDGYPKEQIGTRHFYTTDRVLACLESDDIAFKEQAAVNTYNALTSRRSSHTV